MKDDCYIFIPSYHRANNLKTVRYFAELGWQRDKIVVFIDSEADDKAEYESQCNAFGCKLFVFDMDESRKRYDYVHRPSPARRSAGQARNMFHDYARENGIDFYCVQDDDTQTMSKKTNEGEKKATYYEIKELFAAMEAFMRKWHIGCFGVPQAGDFIGGRKDKIMLNKVMNTTFYLTDYIYRGERGVQDDDTSQFVVIMNQGLFTGSVNSRIFLHQMPSATQDGGLTDLYRELKLLNKSLVTVIQFPSAIIAEKQSENGGRLHHKITNKYLFPRILKNCKRSNIAWDTYEEDVPFTNEPKRNH